MDPPQHCFEGLQRASSAPVFKVENTIDEPIKQPPRSVSFTSVHVQEYSRILGDHPCCSSGLPLGLGWEVESKTSFEFEDYEKNRSRRRGRKEVRLGCEARKDILCRLAAPSTEQEPSSSPTCETPSFCKLYSTRDLRMAERRLKREHEHTQYFRMHNRRRIHAQ